MKAIILAGGLGTRLRSVVSDMPKPMAPVAGRPFLEVLLASLIRKGIDEVVLSVGYKREKIMDYFGSSFNGVPVSYAIEREPLGTGGALLNSFGLLAPEEDVFVLNGDTFLDVDLHALLQGYETTKAEVGIALKLMSDTHRYGRVLVDKQNCIAAFEEKGVHGEGLINAGVYLLKPAFFERFKLPSKFALESDCFIQYLDSIKYYPLVIDSYFIDIGVPEDYEQAQGELTQFA